MPEINPLSNDQIFLKKIAENTGSDYNTGDVSEINPLTIDQILLKEIAANTAGQSGDITELEEKVTANAEAIEATQDIISDTYDPTATYDVGDYCIYNDTLYRCNTAIATPETFTPAKWDAVTVAEELGELTERVNNSEYTHGDIIHFSHLDLWFGYIDVNGIEVHLFKDINISETVTSNQITASMNTSSTMVTVSGAVTLNNITPYVIKTISGIRLSLQIDALPSSLQGTPCIFGDTFYITIQ